MCFEQEKKVFELLKFQPVLQMIGVLCAINILIYIYKCMYKYYF